jgi:tetratricopeptide (TPR) repeat protein
MSITMYLVASTLLGAAMSSIGSKSVARALLFCAFVLAFAACEKNDSRSGAGVSEWDRPATGAQLSGAVFSSSPSFDASNVGTLKIPGKDTSPSPLATETLEVRVFLVGRMARTEVKQVFRNHTNSQTEGTYSFRLPDGASLSRLAMDVEGKMVEGELVEREKARLIYEGIVRKKKDPALLEWSGNNRFSTQLFPIPAKGTKTVILTYEQMLPAKFGQLSYDYSLPNLETSSDVEKIGKFTFTLESEDGLDLRETSYDAKVTQRSLGGQVSLKKTDFTPKGSVRVDLRMKQENIQDATIRTARRAGKGYFLADLPINLPGGNAPGEVKDFILAIDTSAGAGRPVVEQSLAAARTFIERASKGTRFAIITGDLEANLCGEGLDANAALACLKGIRAGGASNLGALIDKAGDAARKLGRPSHAFIIGDGVATLGEMDGELLEARVRYHFADSKRTLHTLAMGHGPNEEGLLGMSRVGGGQALRVVPGEPETLTTVHMQSAVRSALLEDIEVKVTEGKVSGLVPAKPMRMAHGEQLGIFGVTDKPAKLEVKGTYLGKAWKRTIEVGENKSKEATSPQIARFWARGRIADMLDENAPRPDVVALSLEYGVMSPYTSFLVLENQEAYDRYKIKRRKDEEANRQLLAEQGQGQVKPGGNLAKSDGDLKSLLDAKEVKKPKASGAAKRMVLGIDDDQSAFDGRSANPFEIGGLGSIESKKSIATESMSRGGSFGRGGVAHDEVIQQQRVKRVKKRKRKPASETNGLLLGWEEVDQPRSARDKRRLKELESKSSLNKYEMRDIVGTHVRLGQKAKALAAFKKYAGDDAIQDPYFLFGTSTAPEWFTDDYIKIVKPKLDSADKIIEHSSLAISVARALGYREKSEVFLELFGVRLPTPLQTHILHAYLDAHPEAFEKVWTAWRLLYKPIELLGFFEVEGRRPSFSSDRFPHPEFTVLLELSKAGELPVATQARFIQIAMYHKQPDASADYLLDMCSRSEGVAWCLSNAKDYLDMFEDKTRATELEEELAGAYQKAIGALHTRRAEDMGDISKIQEIADIHKRLGQPEKARRVLSEIVEFSPHDYGARTQYARLLTGRKELLEACEQYAISVQLDPKQRDTFRSMIGLRRTKEGEPLADKIRECVVDGVSKLPVKRSLSLVLTWDDPEADVDLHVHENNGQDHVWYRERESSNGGLLYYDITDGYGPEIYVLGGGPTGEYGLSLVYYSGEQENLKAKLTVLRDAGSVDETRKTYEVLLPSADSDTEYSVTTIQFDAKDRSIDGSKVVDP